MRCGERSFNEHVFACVCVCVDGSNTPSCPDCGQGEGRDTTTVVCSGLSALRQEAVKKEREGSPTLRKVVLRRAKGGRHTKQKK